MAILKSLVIRGASKRLGGMVLYSRAGETIARELAPAVSNPRTRVQMEQRVKLGNVVAMYRANRSWMAGAFEDKKENESDYNAFVRMNLSTNNVALTKGHIAAGAGVVAPYQVTSGSIPSIEHTGSQTGVVTNIYMGTLVLTSATTVAQFTQAILANNNTIEEGMQLSLIVNLQRRNEALAMPYIVVRKYELLLNTTDSTLLSEYIPLELLMIRDSQYHPLAYDGSTLGDGAACFILSKTISGRTKVSSQSLVLYGNQSIYSIYTSAIAVNAAIASYGTNEERFLDSNEAKEANAIVIENYIQALSYHGSLFVSSSDIPIDFTIERYPVVIFSQPVEENLTGSLILASDGVEHTITTITFNDDRTRATLTLPALANVEYPADFSIVLESIAEQFDFSATATGTE